MEIFTAIVAILVLLTVYLFPWIIALQNNHKDTTAIFLLNLLLGWTFVFWVISLVWAVKKS